MARFTPEEADSVRRLLTYARRKDFVAALLMNGYDGSYKVSMREVMRYIEGELSGSTYRDDIFVFLDLMRRGIETHEIVGYDVISELSGNGDGEIQIYATIRKQSRYFRQQELDTKGKPIAFKVTIDIEEDPLWPVKGGIGGQYSLYDVDLWIEQKGSLKKLPVHTI